MVPRVAQRGHSFKGAGLYYLHDKGASTSERVAWTHTHNLPTNDPEKAMRWMARTSMNAEKLKAEAGVARTGRKSSAGSVYSFSLAWHPEQNPEKEDMLSATFETLEYLGLSEHQAVMVAHQETEHPHVHVICNLVKPNDGRISVPSYDFLKFSKWAEEQERKNDKIYCEERVKNNERRRGLAKENRENGIVKYKEERPEFATQIQEIYNRSDNGKSFAAALNEAGFKLAKGDRRGFVLVDAQGKIYSLSRQLQGQRASDLKARLSDIDEKSLPNASSVADERRYFDRDRYEADFQKRIVDSAIEEEQVKLEQGKPAETPFDNKRQDFLNVPNLPKKEVVEPFYAKLDKIREQEQQAERKRDALRKQLAESYGRNNHLEKMADLQAQVTKNNTAWGRMTGKLQNLQDELEAHKLTLADIDRRMAEQVGKLEKEIGQSMKDFNSSKPKTEIPSIDLDATRKAESEQSARIEAFKERMRQQRNTPDREQGFDLER